MKNDVGVASIIVGKKIKEIRKKKALTIQELAEISGVSEGHVSRLENGLKSPTISTLEKLANALDVPIVYFFSLLWFFWWPKGMALVCLRASLDEKILNPYI